VIARAVAAVAAAALLAGCSGGGHGRATLWITRDRGASVVKVTHVPAGLTAMQALERAAKVSTRYGGRYVEAIDGIRGSLAAQRDWFYFVNGYEADRSAAEYRLHAGDVEWWDFRDWRHALHVPVVVGAFPEPFLHGWNGHTRATYVLTNATYLPAARKIARAVHGHARLDGVTPPDDANVIVYRPGATAARIVERGGSPGAPVTLYLRTDAANPLRALRAARFRYAVGT
jgi:uncharacterized protein DUF4430